MRYCELCDRWVRQVDCPQCGAGTVPQVRAPRPCAECERLRAENDLLRRSITLLAEALGVEPTEFKRRTV